MRSAVWTPTLLFPVWAAAEKWTLWNTLTCEQQLEEYDGLSFSRFAVYEDHIDCFDFDDNVVANAVAQTKDSFCQVYTSTGYSGEDVQLSCNASNLFDPYYCCTDTPQGMRSAKCRAL
ncbi:hypothetical protein M440DRAFT_1328082 [Trichoderma longibrachiatum ATCC 18648]|uniref:Uncharacterized protein n=1 Tax=Trichoderma longibrachiatum ATCC 18648 TaxID=983965 RepID=A0A2T4CB01_TRILO|nr:hypothetical protein M440DRAFT_1328082 [Trichoderma longibrachiatum ATCC 18648]